MPRVEQGIGGYTAVIDVKPPGTARLSWLRADGTKLARAPAGIAKADPEIFKQIKQKLKSIRSTLRAQTRRIESFYFDAEHLSLPCWRECYAEHPLMKVIAGNLIWLFKDGSNTYSALLQDGRLVSADGAFVPILADATQVFLWHPLHADANERAAWRDYVAHHSVVQPFRQAYREVYQAKHGCDLEAIVDGLYVRQHAFRALLLDRGWRYRFHGSFDCDSTATLNCPGDVRCEIGISSASQTVSNNGVSIAVELSGFGFYRGESRLPAETIPPILYSDVLRHIDLFTRESITRLHRS